MRKTTRLVALMLSVIMVLCCTIIPAFAEGNEGTSSTNISGPRKATIKVGNISIKVSKFELHRYTGTNKCGLYLVLDSNETISDIHFTSFTIRNPNNLKTIYYSGKKNSNGYVHYHLKPVAKKGTIYLGDVTVRKDVKLVKICPANTELYVMSYGWYPVTTMPISTYIK